MSALTLEKHFFSRIELRPNPTAKPEGSLRTVCTVTMGQAAEDPLHFQLTLSTVFEDEPNAVSKPYYSGAIEVVGFFRVSPLYKEDHLRLVHISGASLLYGAVRELLCNLTARGPWPMVTLPTMSFSPVPTQTSGHQLEQGSPGVSGDSPK